MATRGTAILINDDFISMGPEFNGDMHPHGHGDSFLKLLSEVKTEDEFIIFNNRFNKHNFSYDEIIKSYQGKFEADVMKINDTYSINAITQKQGAWITSDWIFIKNATNKQIKTKDLNGEIINVKSNETIRLYFGKLIENGKGHRIKNNA